VRSGQARPGVVDANWSKARTAVLLDATGVGLAVGALGLSFGALSALSGFSVAQTSALSVLMFSGASQFALVGVAASGGGGLIAAATAVLLGARNLLYGLRLSSLLRLRGARRMVGAQLVLDESSAMAIARPTAQEARVAFWATGTAVFVFWNLATLAGALGARVLPDPTALGLDVASPAAFVALLAPRLRERRLLMAALVAGGTALVTVPALPVGLPVLFAGLAAGILCVGRRWGGGTN
jgi:predicted branched-subunit amino acid permease